MPSAYALRLYNTAGALQAVLTDVRGLSYTRRVNAPGAAQLSLAGDHAILSSIGDQWRVQVQRRPDGGDWRTELWALFRDEQWAHGENGSAFTGYCPGILSVLGWRIVNWAAGTANRTDFTSDPAETIMKTLVTYNAGSAATTGNGRKRDGAIAGLTVQADGAGGNTLDWRCHGKNLLETLRELAAVGGGDFDLVPSSPTAYEFRWYAGQRGTDRSATVKFSLALGNMAEPAFYLTRSTEKTVACVWGQGDGSARDYVTRTGANYHATSANTELYVDAKDVEKGATAALQARGDAWLDEAEAKELFQFEALQTDATSYGDEYDLGDLVTAVNPFNGESYTVQVKAVTVTLDKDGGEKIAVEVGTK
jgi:hypothetical protein